MSKVAVNDPPNLIKRRVDTKKKDQCQLCRTKVKISDQFTVVNDLDNNVPVKKKVGTRDIGTLSHYCGDCAKKRVKQKQAWLDQRDDAPKKAAKPKAKKAAAKPKAKAKAGKKGGKAKAKKEKAASADPF